MRAQISGRLLLPLALCLIIAGGSNSYGQRAYPAAPLSSDQSVSDGIVPTTPAASSQADPIEKEVLLIVETDNAWPDCKLQFLLQSRLAEYNFLRVSDSRHAAGLREHPRGILPRDELVELGRRIQCRFILWCTVDQEELIRENNFSLPLLAKQRRVKAKLQARYYLLDCERNRIVRQGKANFENHGPSSLQLVDFGDADPALLVSYQDRDQLFTALETRAAEQIENDLLEVTRLQ